MGVPPPLLLLLALNQGWGTADALVPLPSSHNLGGVLLNQWPMILTHDAATGYLKNGLVDNWAKTQDGGLAEQLDCGARSFDLRPHLQDGKLEMHHGDIVVPHEFKDAMEEVVEWAGRNQTELVVVYISDCTGDTACVDSTLDVLSSFNITMLGAEADIAGLTLSRAMERGRLSNGGSVLAVMNVVEENYDPSIVCYDGTRWCYGNKADEIFSAFWNYMNRTTADLPAEGRLSMVQAHWQENADTVIAGTLLGSSLLKDEERSKTIREVTEKLVDFPHINLIEVNNVCDGGNELLMKLRERLLSSEHKYT
eukprot:jgi/Bigna1/42626/e_gw1.66.33.1